MSDKNTNMHYAPLVLQIAKMGIRYYPFEFALFVDLPA